MDITHLRAKTCTKCGEVKVLSEFTINSCSNTGYYTLCKKCKSISRKPYREANKDELNANSREYYSNNKEKLLIYGDVYYKANRDKLREQQQEYYNNHKEQYFAHNAKRRASKLNATSGWANLEIIKEIYAQCSRLSKETGIDCHVDHLIPLQSKLVCGLHVENNLQIITGSSNSKKCNKFTPGYLEDVLKFATSFAEDLPLQNIS